MDTLSKLYQTAGDRLSKLSLPDWLIHDESGQSSAEEHLQWIIESSESELKSWATHFTLDDRG